MSPRRAAQAGRYASRPILLVLDLNGGTLSLMESVALTREQAIARLVEAEVDIRALGVARLALFGSVLRNDARPDSDVDLLVQFAPGRKSYARFLALSDLLETRLKRRVELVTTEALSPFIGPRILAEAQDVLRAA
jgi:predicted nucleotidyltransferase